MSTEMLDVLSVLDAQDNPVLGNCTLVLGEVALEFKNGRSVVPAQHAPVVARCEKVKIPGYRGPVAPPVPSQTAELPSDGPEQSAAEIAAEYLREQGLEVPTTPEGVILDNGSQSHLVEGDGIEKTGIEVPAGQEGTLEVRSEPVPENEKIHALPEGFEALTAAGEPRCFARTGSGTQCSNAAVADSNACGLGAHREQVG
jgi:hypothetical protein